MFYAIRHFTRYRYTRPIWQSMLEVRMHPRSENNQRCFTFRLSVNPRARIFSFIDYLGNQVHHFDLPSPHREITIIADSLVNIDPPASVPDALPYDSWSDLRRMMATRNHSPRSGRACTSAPWRGVGGGLEVDAEGIATPAAHW